MGYDMKNELELEVLSQDEFDEETRRAIKFYLEDEFFSSLKSYLETEDYNMAKDMVKGLYVLAGELRLFALYQGLLDIYEDLDFEEYGPVNQHYEIMIKEYRRLREVFR